MGWYFRRSARIGPLRLNFSKRGVGYSVGAGGYRVGRSSSGRTYRSFNVAGTGLRYVRYDSAGHPTSHARHALPQSHQQAPNTTAGCGCGCLTIILVIGALLFAAAAVGR